jgi:hypothetical protein
MLEAVAIESKRTAEGIMRPAQRRMLDDCSTILLMAGIRGADCLVPH